MDVKTSEAKYYILATENPERMLLSGMPEANPDDPFEDDWLFGSRFSIQIREPVVVTIQQRHIKGELLPYFDAQPVMSNEFYTALVMAGVNNLDAYDCILRSEDGTVEYKGFKAVNIIGTISATGKKTEFTGASRLMDASMDSIEIDVNKTGGALMFRLAENLSTVVVHEKVKNYIEEKGFNSVVFRDPGNALVL